jgi:hypothetical protein
MENYMLLIPKHSQKGVIDISPRGLMQEARCSTSCGLNLSFLTNAVLYKRRSIHLELGNESIKLDDGVSGGSGAGTLLVQCCVEIGGLHGLEEILSGFLLGWGGGKTTDGTTGIVHVTGELILYVEPLLSGNVCIEVSKTLLGFNEDSHLALVKLWVGSIVESVSISVNRVRGIKRGGLVTSVSGTLRVRGSISENSENGETRRFTGSSVGGSRNENSGTSDLSKSLAAGLL